MRFLLPVRALFLAGLALLSFVGTLEAEELRVRFAYRSIEVSGVTPGEMVALIGVTREQDGLDFDRMREWLRDGDGDGRVRLELPRDLPLSIVAAVEHDSGRAGVATRGIRWAYDLDLVREEGVDVFWLRPGGGDWAARLDHGDLDADLRGGLPPRPGLPKLRAGDLVFVVDLTTLRSVLVKLPEELTPVIP